MDLLEELDKEIANRRAKLEALEQEEPRFAPYRYVVDFTLPFTQISPTTAIPPEEFVRTINIRKDTRFYVKAVEVSYTASGPTTVVPGAVPTTTAVSITLPGVTRASVFDFQWKVRDTGADREWQNTFLPSKMLLSGNESGLQFQRGHALISGGSELHVTLGPVFHLNSASITGLNSIVQYAVQFAFVGIEVKI